MAYSETPSSRHISPKPNQAHWPLALRLLLTPGLGARSTRKLWAEFGCLAAIWAEPVAMLAQAVGEELATAIHSEPPDWAQHCERTLGWLAQAGQGVSHAVWSWDDEAFPQDLMDLPDAPLILFARGQLHLPLGPAVAVVGSRNPTHQGRENARAFAYSLCAGGYAVVSGMAMGIDAAAHQGALQVNAPTHCPTVAVVGTGLDLV